MSEEEKKPDKKKGDLLNQLAIVSDFLEKANIDALIKTLRFNLSDEEYEKVKQYLAEKSEGHITYGDESFGIMIGELVIVFNKNNV